MEPRVRTVQKYKPPYALNDFPPEFCLRLGQELVYFLATHATCDLEGKDWEQIFARSIGAEWKPSSVGLDDIVLGQTAWGAKTVKGNPLGQETVRLISGRNSPVYAYGDTEVSGTEPNALGEKVLEIYNERVSSVRARFRHLRTVVLIKSEDLREVAVFETETLMFDPAAYAWAWNARGNLVGADKKAGAHKFTWQPHGSQFTIVEEVPADALIVRIQPPTRLDKIAVLKQLGFGPDWVTAWKKSDGPSKALRLS